MLLYGIKTVKGKDSYDQIIGLFNKYRYQYHFNRRNVADAFGVEEPAASAIIKKCMNLGIVLCDYVIEELQLVTERKFPHLMDALMISFKDFHTS